MRPLLLAVGVCLVASAARAQDPAPRFRTAVPESPAFTVLGVSPDLVGRPTSVRDLGVALLTGVGPDGGLRQGFALDVTPWVFVPGLAIPLSDYRSSTLARGLANLQLSLGTVTSQGDSAATDFAIGLRTTLFDGTDAMQHRAFTDPVAGALRQCVATVPPGLPEEEGRLAVQACADSVMAAAWDAWGAYSAEHWNAGFLALGAGLAATLPDSRPDGGRYGGARAWIVGGVGVGRSAQLLGQLAVRDVPSVGGAPATREWSWGGRLLYGSAAFHAFGEVVGVSISDPEGRDGTGASWSAGLELRLTEGLWATTGFGQRFEGLGQPERLVVLLGLKFGVVASSRVGALGRS